MGHIHSEVHWESPAERVFDVAADVTLLPQVMSGVKDVVKIAGVVGEAGSTYSFHSTFLGRSRAGTIEVLAADRPSLFSTLATYDNGTTVTWTQRFAAAGTGTDEVDDVEYRLPPGITATLLGPLVQRSFEAEGRKSVRRFANLLTAGPASDGIR